MNSTHTDLWRRQGAHVLRDAAGHLVGTRFTVWAPHARDVQVKGDFNDWDGGRNPLTRGDDGVWTTVIDGVAAGARYKFAIHGSNGHWSDRADPLARRAEVAPASASIVEESHYTWDDGPWLARRSTWQAHAQPFSTYEVHLASWRRGRCYRDLADDLTAYVVEMGFTHVELMPVMQHPFGGSWGYHVTGYYAPDSRLGSPDDFRYLVDKLHQAGIGIILDWVPGHFATDDWALGRFDGQALYEHPDPQRGFHPEWGSWIFDFGRPEVRDFLISNALYWAEEFHVDGLRVDGVASMLYLDYSRNDGEWKPNIHGGHEHLEAVQFLQELNEIAYGRVPGIVLIAEESTAWPGVTRATEHGGLGFGFKWNMGWMHDTLEYMQREPVHRPWHQHDLALPLTYAWSENFVLPLSHDEVVHGKGSLLTKMPGSREQQFAGLRAYLAFQWAHPGKQLLFMGCEIGQVAEWAESGEINWWLLDPASSGDAAGHSGVQALVRDLNRVYRDCPALWSLDNQPDGFRWIDADDRDHSTFCFLRQGGGAELVAILNLSDQQVRRSFDLPEGSWRAVLNTDGSAYGGHDRGPSLPVTAADTFDLPPLTMLWLRRVSA
ncbi:1,4-alpha-glucan branching protein GlgB [Nocardioides sp. Kera G14]|uniref:1,4-alpha-glucan branching protein GlgB n=1 Tax=Nocardioides sp. Kera G14 TaxID=2884264 RepID=UPI001D0FD3FF|nr:1,4-alpha-glucan branching protein GlgB [Nocardioides sp. Kera G14]UDY24759.1 1,4-alpha-glucan branching protein GlgB [Nocardioides sp. Kera G14]